MKLHDVLRTLQWLIPAAVTLYAVLDRVFGWGHVAEVEMIAAAFVTFIGVIAQHSSALYFETREIIEKDMEDLV